MVSFITIVFLVVKLKIFIDLCTSSASIKWPFLGGFWVLAPKFGFKFGCFQISNPKNQNIFIKKKMNKDFFLFSVNIGNFFQVGLEQKNQLIQTKKNVANQPCSKGTFLVCTEKIYIKKSFKYSVSITIQNKFLDSSLLLRE